MKFSHHRITLLIFLIFCIFLKSTSAESISLTAQVKGTTFVFGGFTAPNSLVILSENSAIIGTTTSDNNGTFVKEINAVTPGIHTIDIWSANPDGFNTDKIRFDLIILANQEMDILNIYLPPTLELDATTYQYADTIKINGYSKPNSGIIIHINGSSVFTTNVSTNAAGQYSANIPASTLGTGNYNVRVELVRTEIIDNSTLTSTRTFIVQNKPTQNTKPTNIALTILPQTGCPYPYPRLCFFDIQMRGYLDDKAEFLKFLSGYIKYWEQDFDTIYDINQDKHINSLDLSIVLYYWRGDNSQIMGYYDNSAIADASILNSGNTKIQGASTQKTDNTSDMEMDLITSFVINEIYVVLIVLFIFSILLFFKKRKNES